jgi:outer membrane autotransporter protein
VRLRIILGLTLLAAHLSIEAAPVDFESQVQGGNIGAVAKALDKIDLTHESDLASVVGILPGLNNSDLKAALNQLQPSFYNGFALAQENNSIRVATAISKRLEELYLTDCTRWCEPNKVGVWGDVFGDFATQNNTQHQAGYRVKTGGALAGVDYGCLNNFFLGASAAYTYTDIDWKKAKGDGHINSYYGGIYAAWISDFAYLDASALGAFNQYHGTRRIHFAEIDRDARNNHHGAEFDARLEGGIFIPYKGLDIRPYDSLEYVYVHENRYSERGAGDLDLAIRSKNSMLLRNELGLGLAFCRTLERWNMVPDFKLGWIREWRFKGKHTTAEFEGTDVTFKVTGIKPDRNLVSPSVGLTGLFYEDQMQVTLRYDAEFGKNYRDQNVNFQVSYAF